MPEPASSRQRSIRRPPILRVRTGCFTCRTRKKKCDEARPVCSGCKRNRLACKWPTRVSEKQRLHYSSQGARCGRAVDEIKLPAPEEDVHIIPDPQHTSCSSLSASNTVTYDSLALPRPSDKDMALPAFEEPMHVRSASTASPRSPSIGEPTAVANVSPLLQTYEVATLPMEDTEDDVQGSMEIIEERRNHQIIDFSGGDVFDQFLSASLGSVPTNPSVMPGAGNRTFELMSYYLGRTASSMGNGSTISNPFIVQLIPLSFSSNLVRQLILSQSAAHRAVSDERGDAVVVAQSYYVRSIRSFRRAISEYIDGTEPCPLWIAIGALVMCFTETARGDTNGVVFDHLQAAEPLLIDLISNHRHVISDDLKMFILEYYIYTATISMISVRPSARSMPFLNPILENEARNQATAGYIGQLCGCWLQLLLLIPRIFEFGRRMTPETDGPQFPSPDDFMSFAAIQSEILAFTPPASVMDEVTICGYIFQQAIYLYLLTSFDTNISRSSMQQMSIDNAVSEAFFYLEQLPSAARVNTSLCWALAVIGSCTICEERRDLLRQRLKCMFTMIGLGNITTTLALLEHLWRRSRSEQNPWTICRVMEEQETWISFA